MRCFVLTTIGKTVLHAAMQAFVPAEEIYTPFSDSSGDQQHPMRRPQRPAAAPRPSPADAAAVPSVYVVEDDASVRKAIARLLLPLQCPVHLFGSAEQFLGEMRPGVRGCLVLDV